jgi:hypothetical protein
MNRSSHTVVALLTTVWLIAAAAFATRAFFIWDQQRKIPHHILATVPFDQEAGNIALALSQGNGFSNLFRQNTGPTAWLAPVYPLLLSRIFQAFGAFTITSFFVAVFLNALFSGLTTFPLYYLAQQICGRTVASVVSWLWVFLPAGVLMPFEWVWDTSLSVLLATTILWMTLHISSSSKTSLWAAYAFLWATTLLTNPSLGIALPFLLFWAALRARKLFHISWPTPILALLLIFVCCLPWTIRNYARFDRLIPVRSNLAFELWIGNNDIFDEHAVGGIQRITRFEEARHYAQLAESAYLAEKWHLANTFISQKPSLFLMLTGKRILATWFGTEHPVTDFLTTDSLLVRTVIACNLLLTLGTLFGICFLARSGNSFVFPVAVFPLLYPLVYYVTHTSLRYRHPIDPILVLLTVISLKFAFSRFRVTSPLASFTV